MMTFAKYKKIHNKININKIAWKCVQTKNFVMIVPRSLVPQFFCIKKNFFFYVSDEKSVIAFNLKTLFFHQKISLMYLNNFVKYFLVIEQIIMERVHIQYFKNKTFQNKSLRKSPQFERILIVSEMHQPLNLSRKISE